MPTTTTFISACQSATYRYLVPVRHQAIHSFAVSILDVNEQRSRLRLNPTKTQVMWLGSGQQLKHVDINDIPVLSTTVKVVESARDLGIIVDSRLTLSAHVATLGVPPSSAALCRAGYYQLRQLRNR